MTTPFDPATCRRVALLAIVNMLEYSREKDRGSIRRVRIAVDTLRVMLQPHGLPPEHVDLFLDHLNIASYSLGYIFQRASDVEVVVMDVASIRHLTKIGPSRIVPFLHSSLPELESRLSELHKLFPPSQTPTYHVPSQENEE